MPIDDSDEAVERCRATLGSFDRQIWTDWSLRLIVRYRDLDFGVMVENLREGRDSAILDILRGKNFVRADNAEYANIRSVAAQLKLL